MSGFNSYKIRDGKHIPSQKYKDNWNGIFGKKEKPKKNKEELKGIKLTYADNEPEKEYTVFGTKI
jgi:hypothetical protein|tara:strand:- start:84 stop:278 length:195 start_codon:yes stop_codon:yes gene_type:complete